jgi:hypothetical protein
MSPICDRCGGDATISIMSRFNTESICLACEKKERAHPDYKRAARIELEAVQRGDYNFPGIGKPEDL